MNEELQQPYSVLVSAVCFLSTRPRDKRQREREGGETATASMMQWTDELGLRSETSTQISLFGLVDAAWGISSSTGALDPLVAFYYYELTELN